MTDTAADLTPVPLWADWSRKIGAKYLGGEPFPDIFEMNLAIKQRDLAPYHAHRARLDAHLWRDDPNPKQIVDFGAGYGAMANVWPDGSHVTNIDLPEMLAIQRDYVTALGHGETGYRGTGYRFVPFYDADSVDLTGAYFFAAWSLTETTPETWAYYARRLRAAAGAYVVGFKAWDGVPWPWEALRAAFNDVRVDEDWPDDPGQSRILIAANR